MGIRRKCSGSLRKGSGSRLECPLTIGIHPTHTFHHGLSMITLDDLSSARRPYDREARLCEDGKLWTRARMKQHGSGPTQQLPIISMFDIFCPGSTGKSIWPSEHVGLVTSATISPSQPGVTYVGHEGGWLLNTDNRYPQCIEVTRVAMLHILCLEGVNDWLWAGRRNGMISAYDVSQLVIVRGNPGVFQLYPYPTLHKPLPLSRVRVFSGFG